MKFFALAALVATTQAAADATVADGAECTAAADKECKVATSSCCKTYSEKEFTTALKSYCHAAVTADQTVKDTVITTPDSFIKKADCAGRTAGASALAATAAAATALYAMC